MRRCTCLCALFLMLLGVSVRAQNRPAKPSNDTAHAQATQSAAQPSPIIVQVPSTQRTEQEAAEEKRRADDESAIKHPELALTLVIAIAAAVQAFGIIWQIFIYKKQSRLMARSLSATRKSALAAEKSAEAAMLSSKSLIGSERSWVLVAIDETEDEVFDPWIFKLRATNHGNSPAEILWVYSTYSALYLGDDLPEEPDYGVTDRIFGHRRWIPSGEGFDVDKLNIALPTAEDPVEFADLQAGRKWLWVYGVIRYRDSISPSTHESRFCYLVNFQTGPRIDGPAGYNDCT